MFGNSRMFNNSSMHDNSEMHDNSRMYYNSEMHGNSKMFDSARMFDNSAMSDYSRMYDWAVLSGNARLEGGVSLRGFMHVKNATIKEQKQLFYCSLKARTGIYQLTLYWVDGKAGFTWGCRDGEDILEYLKNEIYPDNTVKFIKNIVEYLKSENE